MNDTIFAISSGAPPAAIAIVRVSGPRAKQALSNLTGRDIPPRRASLASLRDAAGGLLDQALVLFFPGPNTASGEDLAELHCHGGRAVLAAVTGALAAMAGLRPAEPGEFTRRAFANGRIDLAQAEGLADLLAAETELQRSSAIRMAGGAVSRRVDDWRERVLALSALVESALDFSDEDDVGDFPPQFGSRVQSLREEIETWLRRPRSEALGEGFRVAIAGPPNAGKSTLFNALIESEAAITSPIAGTTRDVISRSVAIEGVPFTFVDTAGLRVIAAGSDGDPIEAIGIERAHAELAAADIILWLGAEGEGPERAWEIAARSDAPDFVGKTQPKLELSAASGANIDQLKRLLLDAAREALPKPGEAALNARQHARLAEAAEALRAAENCSDLLIAGEELRLTRLAFDRLTGRASTEDMLDTLFGRFCIGK